MQIVASFVSWRQHSNIRHTIARSVRIVLQDVKLACCKLSDIVR